MITREQVAEIPVGNGLNGEILPGPEAPHVWCKAFSSRQPMLERFAGCLRLRVWQPKKKDPSKVRYSVSSGRCEEVSGCADSWEQAMADAEAGARAVGEEILAELTK